MHKKTTFFILFALLASAGAVLAKETRVIVRVLAHDAKFIGSSMGGARITITDAGTGAVLAEGITRGGTGNTTVIMKKPLERHAPLADDKTAFFEAVLDIDKPLLVKISAEGPLARPQSITRTSREIWLLPGKDILGDGVILRLSGFALEIVSPHSLQRFSLKKSGGEIPIRVNMVMMCGCPIAPDGLWDANRYEVTAYVKQEGKVVAQFPLSFAGETSFFKGVFKPEKPGRYEILVTAYDPGTGNTGVDSKLIIVGK